MFPTKRINGGKLLMLLYILICTVTGDFNVPSHAPSIPQKFKELLNTDKISHVLCTGNLGSKEVYKFLRDISSNLHIVRGDKDVELPDYPEPASFPESTVVTIGGIRIGLIHGHQIIPTSSTDGLARWQRSVDCDIIASGYTHQRTAEKVDGKVYINPGSATGVRAPFSLESHAPSFMLMSVQEDQSSVILYAYELQNGAVTTSMSEFCKDNLNET